MMQVPKAAPASTDFGVARLGVIMSSQAGEPHEAWGVLNPAGVRSPDGAMHLFPRLVAEGNYSRIGHALVGYEGDTPVAVERLGIALEPHESYEGTSGGGGVEDPRVVYVPQLECYVMTYTAFVPYEPRVGIAVSEDLYAWRRLGLLQYETSANAPDLNLCGNKDAAMFPDVVSDPNGVPSLAILHRPTTLLSIAQDGCAVRMPPCGKETREHIWISYAPLAAVLDDITTLALVRQHERIMAPVQSWESNKVGAGPPPIRLPYGWLLPYHAVSAPDGHPRYCMGAAILDLERPSRILYRSATPILEPQTGYERNGLVSDVVFPTATDLRADGLLDIFYGAADQVIAVARLTLPTTLPTTNSSSLTNNKSFASRTETSP